MTIPSPLSPDLPLGVPRRRRDVRVRLRAHHHSGQLRGVRVRRVPIPAHRLVVEAVGGSHSMPLPAGKDLFLLSFRGRQVCVIIFKKYFSFLDGGRGCRQHEHCRGGGEDRV